MPKVESSGLLKDQYMHQRKLWSPLKMMTTRKEKPPKMKPQVRRLHLPRMRLHLPLEEMQQLEENQQLPLEETQPQQQHHLEETPQQLQAA